MIQPGRVRVNYLPTLRRAPGEFAQPMFLFISQTERSFMIIHEVKWHHWTL